MFEKEAEEYVNEEYDFCYYPEDNLSTRINAERDWRKGAEFGYNKANEWHSPNEHINKDRVVLGYIKYCNKKRYSLVQWNGEWWYQYGSFNAEVRLIAWCELPKFGR